MDDRQLERSMRKVLVTENCWLWTAAVNNGGYGVFGLCDGVVINAHRASYEHHIGDIPELMEIHHQCEVRNCVNPAHLRVVTHSENIRLIATKRFCRNGHPKDLSTWKGRCLLCLSACGKRFKKNRPERAREITRSTQARFYAKIKEKYGMTSYRWHKTDKDTRKKLLAGI